MLETLGKDGGCGSIVEMSSYQLEHPGFFKPKVGVITNLTPDHLDHHKDMLTYAYMKCRLFKDMDKDDVAIIPVDQNKNRPFNTKYKIAQRKT
ncbi:hypothetical protein CBR_g671 [Chara braunii]|uniref:Mur ligase central domain-containing protein n=1 Tax=Chara braunii TaxID=69332 RepID=A0A388KBW6_CHABU|nr:hypothetical protein CBR_g671 [Chara braunii]|eukprot:GBG67540.1 hypothetical protein CBR_g671 [Chara braunii]